MADEAIVWEEVDHLVVNGRVVYPPRPNAAVWTVQLFRILANRGGRMLLEEAVQYAMPFVPPGKAYREAETHRLASARKRGSDNVELRTDPDMVEQSIRAGQREKVMDSINMMSRYDRLRIETDENGTRWLSINVDWKPQERMPSGSAVSKDRSGT